MKVMSSAVVPVDEETIRLTVRPASGRQTALDFHRTDADAVGCVMKQVAKSLRGDDLIENLIAERDALTAAIEVLSRPQLEKAA